MLHGLQVSLLYSLPDNILLTVLDSNTDTQTQLDKLAIPRQYTMQYSVPHVQMQVTLPDSTVHHSIVVIV